MSELWDSFQGGAWWAMRTIATVVPWAAGVAVVLLAAFAVILVADLVAVWVYNKLGGR